MTQVTSGKTLLIIEGIDLMGKSRLIKQLSTQLQEWGYSPIVDHNYVGRLKSRGDHSDRRAHHQGHHEMVVRLAAALHATNSVIIMDRFHLTEIAGRTIEGKNTKFFMELDQYLAGRDVSFDTGLVCLTTKLGNTLVYEELFARSGTFRPGRWNSYEQFVSWIIVLQSIMSLSRIEDKVTIEDLHEKIDDQKHLKSLAVNILLDLGFRNEVSVNVR